MSEQQVQGHKLSDSDVEEAVLSNLTDNDLLYVVNSSESKKVKVGALKNYFLAKFLTPIERDGGNGIIFIQRGYEIEVIFNYSSDDIHANTAYHNWAYPTDISLPTHLIRRTVQILNSPGGTIGEVTIQIETNGIISLVSAYDHLDQQTVYYGGFTYLV